jgi:hypothetical protein
MYAKSRTIKMIARMMYRTIVPPVLGQFDASFIAVSPDPD